jgi:lipoprotein-anchoring transpeptidase ErfK/SrfK
MRGVTGCVALSLVLFGGPLAAKERALKAGESEPAIVLEGSPAVVSQGPAIAEERAAAVAQSTVSAPAVESAPTPNPPHGAPQEAAPAPGAENSPNSARTEDKAPAATAPAAAAGTPVVSLVPALPTPSVAAGIAEAVGTELAPPPPPPPITLVLKADLTTQRLSVVERGKVVYVWPISSGQRGYATQPGTFHPQWLSRMWYSRQWDMAPMPHAVFFNGGTAFHGTNAVGSLGRPASHGCVRLAPGNAARLFALVQKHGFAGTKVIVHGRTAHSEIAERAFPRRDRRFAGRPQRVVAGPYSAYPVRNSGRVSRYGARSGPYFSF